MRAQLLKYWDRIRSSFWFLPSLMALGAVGLAFAAIAVDEAMTERWLHALSWLYTGGAEGASAVLQTIAGSMITIAGVVFSLTLVALSLASSQFGPRLLRNFMRDTTNQLVLGTFVATFLYCLLILRTIRRDDAATFVPHLSVTLGVVFALAGLWVLIYFIHHVSVSIQADEIVSRIGKDLMKGIDHLFPESEDRGDRTTATPTAGPGLPPAFEREARAMAAGEDGYLQLIDLETLVKQAEKADVILQMERRPGDYVIAGSPLLKAWPGERLTDELSAKLTAAFALGDQRTPAQDVGFTVQQLVEIAARALSPGINDPFTAIACVDRLGSGLYRLAQRDIPSPQLLDQHRHLRVVACPTTFRDIVDTAFNQIRHHARTSTAVTIRLLATITVIAGAVRGAEDRAVLREHADMIARGAQEELPEYEDRRAVEAQYDAARQALGATREAGEPAPRSPAQS